MKAIIFATIFILIFTLSCSNDDGKLQGEFEFITEYSTKVTVGGVVGIIDRTFKIGEIYKGTDEGQEIITIRIAEHTDLNKDCPNSWCYQELLNVPREFLKVVE
jgi:hypothetical protein